VALMKLLGGLKTNPAESGFVFGARQTKFQ
jgi:hypothetical protein